jgi:hypothetical protein
MRRGARPSDVARKLLEREGILQRSAQSRRVVTAPPEPAAEPAPAPAAEAPAAEAETPEVEAAAEEARAEEAEEQQA